MAPRPYDPEQKDIFVNREGPISIFADAVHEIPADRPSLLTFYGMGGQGKTALCRKLKALATDKKDSWYSHLKAAELDLHGRDKSDPDMLLVWIRNGFASAGIACPAFDLAFAVSWEANRGEEPLPKLTNAWLSKAGEFAGETTPEAVAATRETLEKSVETIPGVGPALTRLGKWAIDKSKSAYLHKACPYLKHLYDQTGELKKPYQLSELMAWMLAQDLNRHIANNPNQRLLLLIDEYERVFDQGGAGKRWEDNPFDGQMRKFLSCTQGLLAVFLSRERLVWEQSDDWKSDLEDRQHLLGGLKDKDADDWLVQTGVDDEPIREAMIDGAREEKHTEALVYPFLLELQTAHWRALKNRGGPITASEFDVAHDNFAERRRELVQRLMRDYGERWEKTLERLAIVDRFDRPAFECVIKTFNTGLAFDQIDDAARLSFISKADDGFLVMHRAFANALEGITGAEKTAETIRTLLAHYEARAKVETPKDLRQHHVTALFEAARLRREQGANGYVAWLAPFSDTLTQAAWYARDEQLWRDATELCERALGKDHPDTAQSYNNVASKLNARGRYDEAEPLYRKALEILERVLGADHPSTTKSYNNVAFNLNAQGRYDEAEPLYRKGLEIRERDLGPDHPSTATNYNNVAHNLDAQGHYVEAEALYRKALEIHERVLGMDHPSTATSYNNVAANLYAQGRHREATPIYRKAMEIYERVLGPDHPDTATSYNNVAVNLDAQGQYDEAEPLLRKALEIYERVLGVDHPSTATNYNSVAFNLNAQGQYDEAESLLRKALEIRERVLGVDHPDTAQSYNNLASNLNDQGRYDEAEPLCRKALEIRERVLGVDHPSTATSYNSVAFNLNAQGQYDEADPLFRKALEIHERVSGVDHPYTASSNNNLAKNLQAQGRYEEAEPLYRKAVELFERLLGPDHPHSKQVRSNLEKFLKARGL